MKPQENMTTDERIGGLRPFLSLFLGLSVLTACAIVEPEPEPLVVIEEEPAYILLGEPEAEAPVVVEVRSRTSPARPRPGVLTAGDIDDTLNLPAFERYLARASRELDLPRIRLSNALQVRVADASGRPLPGTFADLSRPGQGSAGGYHEMTAGPDGLVTVLPDNFGARGLTLSHAVFTTRTRQGDRAGFMTQESDIRHAARRGDQIPTLRLDATDAADWQPDFLDLAFVIDTTGSMADELDWLTREIRTIVSAAKRDNPGIDIRYGLVVYRDRGDEYTVKNYGFTGSLSQMQRRLKAQEARGGGDYPEAAALALRTGARLDWRRGNGERLMFHIADAPPHREDATAYLAAAREAAQKGVQVFGLGASGVAAESEFLMRQAAAMSNGRYLFLTDDSGVGYGHAEPTISCYRVTLLNDLMIRVLRSELTGRRIEADRSEIVREVGVYDRGVCRN